VSDERRELLERHGRLYGDLRLAIAWTVTNRANSADDPRPKKVTTNGWPQTTPLADAHHGESVFGQGINLNPVVVLRTSGLVAFECDTEEGLARIAALDLPATVTVCSSLPYKRHYWFRPPSELEQLDVVCFRFEAQGLSADRERYLLCPPALHPSGSVYRFLEGPRARRDRRRGAAARGLRAARRGARGRARPPARAARAQPRGEGSGGTPPRQRLPVRLPAAALER
jgi:hypothetical protein